MTIAEVIQFEGPQNALVWKYPVENFNATSQLIVDETHEALLVINGNAADLFGPGRRTLTVPNIPLASKLINIPTNGQTPFPCKVFFINKVHHLDLLWGTHGPITLEDPLYDIFMHVMAHGSMSVSIDNVRQFMLKMVGFRDQFGPEELIKKFRGIISSHVKDSISKIMINGMLSYFMMNAHMFELGGVIKERLDKVFEEYGVIIHHFNLESIEVPEADYRAVSQAKERRTGRMIEGYTWQEERQMVIAEKFASNESTLGNVSGALGGLMVGGVMGGNIFDIAREALDPSKIPAQKPPKDGAGTSPRPGSAGNIVDVARFFKAAGTAEAGKAATCMKCGAGLPEHAKFCLECGERVTVQAGMVCPQCGESTPAGKFCLHCGTSLAPKKCPQCGTELPANGKFCLECGEKL